MNSEQDTVTAKQLSKTLKGIVSAELQNLPALLEQMEPRDRVHTIIQLLPYVSPKVSPVATGFGEPTDFYDWLNG